MFFTKRLVLAADSEVGVSRQLGKRLWLLFPFLKSMASSAVTTESFDAAFPEFAKITRRTFLKKPKVFLQQVVNKFGTAEEACAATAAKKGELGSTAWLLVLAAREGRLGREYSLEPFVDAFEAAKAAVANQAFIEAFPELEQITCKDLKEKSKVFLKAVIDNFGTDVQAATARTTGNRKQLAQTACLLVLEARQGRLGKEYSREPFAASEDVEEDAEGEDGCVQVHSESTNRTYSLHFLEVPPLHQSLRWSGGTSRKWREYPRGDS
jgi:hypothetical protein